MHRRGMRWTNHFRRLEPDASPSPPTVPTSSVPPAGPIPMPTPATTMTRRRTRPPRRSRSPGLGFLFEIVDPPSQILFHGERYRFGRARLQAYTQPCGDSAANKATQHTAAIDCIHCCSPCRDSLSSPLSILSVRPHPVTRRIARNLARQVVRQPARRDDGQQRKAGHDQSPIFRARSRASVFTRTASSTCCGVALVPSITLRSRSLLTKVMLPRST